MKHSPPQWMLEAKQLDEQCRDCGHFLRFAENQTFCVTCWERRTRQMIEQSTRQLALYKVRLLQASNEIFDDDTGGLIIYEEEAIKAQQWERVLDWKWRIAVLEMTGKHLPNKPFDSEVLK